MKNVIIVFFAVLGFVFLTSMIMSHSPNQSSQPSQKGGPEGKPIPANVVKIAERSCLKCHANGGNEMAMMHVNLSDWDKYSPEKQAKKAKLMCKMVSKGKMPPKGFREDNPGAAPTKDEAKVICDWSASIQMPKK
jgi:hypothetical protein